MYLMGSAAARNISFVHCVPMPVAADGWGTVTVHVH